MIDAKAFIQNNFQTPANVSVRLKSHGLPAPKLAAVEKWLQRGSIPSEWLPLLMYVLEIENGKPVSIVTYLTGKAR